MAPEGAEPVLSEGGAVGCGIIRAWTSRKGALLYDGTR